ncbi:MAG: hypothetical protein LBR30_01780 [Clostridioides sp.]|jgi:hypothetical protein|nr:hypothetical protein [Clostridioides sp.]
MKQDFEENIQVPTEFHQKLLEVLDSLPEKTQVNSESIFQKKKHKFNKKLKIVAVVFVFIFMGSSIYGISNILKYEGIGSNGAYYTEFPSISVIKKDFDFSPKLVENFKNGYKFNSGTRATEKILNDNNQIVEKYNSIEFEYKFEKKIINVSMNNKKTKDVYLSNKNIIEVKGIKLVYNNVIYKLVPEGYKKSLDDIEKEKKEELIISESSSVTDVEFDNMQFLSWNDAGVNYCIQTSVLDLNQEDLVNMAEEIIN